MNKHERYERKKEIGLWFGIGLLIIGFLRF